VAEIDSVYVEAEGCQKHHKGENVLVRAVCAMLSIAGIGSMDAVLEKNNV
jgi:hypothetical protein